MALQSPIQPRPVSNPNFKPNVPFRSYDRSKWIKVAIFGLLLFFAILASYLTTTSDRFGFNLLNRQDKSSDVLFTDDGQATERFYDDIQERTYDEIKSEVDESNDDGDLNAPRFSPNISNQETRERVDSITGNVEPENFPVLFEDEGISNEHLLIKQGDLVTWRNESSGEMEVVGSGWGTFAPRESGSAYSQRFDFLGVYEYTVNGEFSGTVEVVRAEEFEVE